MDLKVSLDENAVSKLKNIDKRYKFTESKMTKQRLKRFISECLQDKYQQYYESEPKKLLYHSNNIVSKLINYFNLS